MYSKDSSILHPFDHGNLGIVPSMLSVRKPLEHTESNFKSVNINLAEKYNYYTIYASDFKSTTDTTAIDGVSWIGSSR